MNGSRLAAGIERTMRTGAAVLLDGLTKRYGTVEAIADINLEVEPGTLTTLLGPSGSGKTTTLMAVAGFVSPDTGRVLIDGRPIDDVPPHRRDLGIVFQNYALFPHMTVFKNVAFSLEVRRVPRAEIRQRVGDALELVSLSGLDERLPRQLSGGQQQRVALARALVYRPRVLLMDEPLGALDKNLRLQMQTEIKHLQTELGLTVMYVTHDQSEAISLSDKVAVFNHGRIVQAGDPEVLYRRPLTQFVATFLGEAVLFPGSILSRDATSGVAQVALGPGIEGAALCPPTLRSGDAVRVVVRPENLAVTREAREPRIPCVVESVAFLGDAYRLQLRTSAGGSVTAKYQTASRDAVPDPGANLFVSWSVDDAYVVPDEIPPPTEDPRDRNEEPDTNEEDPA